MVAVVLVRIQVLVLLLGEEWFVRIEGLDLKIPVVLGMIGADELQPVCEGLCLGLVFLPASCVSG